MLIQGLGILIGWISFLQHENGVSSRCDVDTFVGIEYNELVFTKKEKYDSYVTP